MKYKPFILSSGRSGLYNITRFCNVLCGPINQILSIIFDDQIMGAY